MQDRYACDIGDFGKYSLLHALAGTDLRLGIIWYLNPVEENNNDGGFTEYPELRGCNERLYDAVHALLQKGQRNLAAIERGGILPVGTKFFSKPLPANSQRERWIQDAANAVTGTDIVFLDPDNGLPDSAEAWLETPENTRRSKKWSASGVNIGVWFFTSIRLGTDHSKTNWSVTVQRFETPGPMRSGR